eukprot:Gb_09926 [translate_table: standard]
MIFPKQRDALGLGIELMEMRTHNSRANKNATYYRDFKFAERWNEMEGKRLINAMSQAHGLGVTEIRRTSGSCKKRVGQKSSGRLEGRAQQRQAQHMIAERRRMRKILRKKCPTKPSTEEDGEEEEFTEDELQMVGLGYYRSVRFKDKDDPTLRHPHDWYKYGPHAWKVPIGEGEVEGEMDTYYGRLCRILGVDVSTSENDVISAYGKLNDEQKSLCWDFLFTNNPVQLLHPFTKGWRAYEETIAR